MGTTAGYNTSCVKNTVYQKIKSTRAMAFESRLPKCITIALISVREGTTNNNNVSIYSTKYQSNKTCSKVYNGKILFLNIINSVK